MAASFVHFAGATTSLAPSTPLRLCQKALISTGVWNPPVRARIHKPPRVLERDGELLILGDVPEDNARYNRTDRDLSELKRQRFYPAALLDALVKEASAKHLKVLDLGCGDGKLVEELQRKGVDAVGLDAHLTRYQMSKDYFIKAAAHRTGEPEQSYDIVIATQSPLSWPYNKALVRETLNEVERILKFDGRLLVSAIDVGNNMNLHDMRPSRLLRGTAFERLPFGLQIKSAPDLAWLLKSSENTNDQHANYWLELVRFRTGY